MYSIAINNALQYRYCNAIQRECIIVTDQKTVDIPKSTEL